MENEDDTLQNLETKQPSSSSAPDLSLNYDNPQCVKDTLLAIMLKIQTENSELKMQNSTLSVNLIEATLQKDSMHALAQNLQICLIERGSIITDLKEKLDFAQKHNESLIRKINMLQNSNYSMDEKVACKVLEEKIGVWHADLAAKISKLEENNKHVQESSRHISDEINNFKNNSLTHFHGLRDSAKAKPTPVYTAANGGFDFESEDMFAAILQDIRTPDLISCKEYFDTLSSNHTKQYDEDSIPKSIKRRKKL